VRILPARIHRPLEECRAHEPHKTQQQNEHNVGCAEIRVSKLGFLTPFWNTYFEMFNLWILQDRGKKKKRLKI
jgi:hypothetical protein